METCSLVPCGQGRCPRHSPFPTQAGELQTPPPSRWETDTLYPYLPYLTRHVSYTTTVIYLCPGYCRPALPACLPYPDLPPVTPTPTLPPCLVWFTCPSYPHPLPLHSPTPTPFYPHLPVPFPSYRQTLIETDCDTCFTFPLSLHGSQVERWTLAPIS